MIRKTYEVRFPRRVLAFTAFRDALGAWKPGAELWSVKSAPTYHHEQQIVGMGGFMRLGAGSYLTDRQATELRARLRWWKKER